MGQVPRAVAGTAHGYSQARDARQRRILGRNLAGGDRRARHQFMQSAPAHRRNGDGRRVQHAQLVQADAGHHRQLRQRDVVAARIIARHQGHAIPAALSCVCRPAERTRHHRRRRIQRQQHGGLDESRRRIQPRDRHVDAGQGSRDMDPDRRCRECCARRRHVHARGLLQQSRRRCVAGSQDF